MKISASQIKTYKLCRKKWWLEKVKKLPTGKAGYGALFGSVVHGVLERLHKGKELYPEEWDLHLKDGDSEVARKLVSLYIPEEGIEPGNIEGRFEIPLYRDMSVVGYIDLYKEGHVIDHKTTSAMKWALKPRELARDDQMLIYAKYVLEKYPDTNLVKLQHNVFLRSHSPKHKTTIAYVSKNAILNKWEELKDLGRDMKRDRVGPCPRIVMGDHCKVYGGCPFAPLCAGTMTEGQYNTVKGRQLKMADELAKKLAALEAKKRGIREPVQEPAPPVLEVEPEVEPVKKKRGRPKGSKNKKDTGPTVRADHETAPLPKLTLYVGCTPIKRSTPGVYISLEEAFKRILGDEAAVEGYFESNAFERRDALIAQTGRWLVDHPPVSVIAPPAAGHTPDMKSLVVALRLRAEAVIEALG